MADTAVDTTVTAEVTAKELKEKKEVAEVKVEEDEEKKKKTDNGDAPANGTNGADHSDKVEETEEEEDNKNGDGNAKEASPVEETDAPPVKRAAEDEVEEENVDTKKQKTGENGDAKEAEVEA